MKRRPMYVAPGMTQSGSVTGFPVIWTVSLGRRIGFGEIGAFLGLAIPAI